MTLLNALKAPLLNAAAAAGTSTPTLPTEATLLQKLEYPLVGFGFVLGGLACSWLACEVASAFYRAKAARQAANAGAPAEKPAAATPAPAPGAAARTAPVAAAPAAAAAAPVAAAAAPEPDAEIPFAVIAAAIAAVLHEPHRIVAVQPLGAMAWSVEGRRSHFASHQLQRR